MADANFTAPSMEQMQYVLSDIAILADGVQEAFRTWDGEQAALSFLMFKTISQIGSIADTFSGNHRLKETVEWLVPTLPKSEPVTMGEAK